MSDDVSHILGWVAAVSVLLAVVLVVTGVPFIVVRAVSVWGGSDIAPPRQVRQGLSTEEWKQILAGRGLSETPKLRRPTD